MACFGHRFLGHVNFRSSTGTRRTCRRARGSRRPCRSSRACSRCCTRSRHSKIQFPLCLLLFSLDMSPERAFFFEFRSFAFLSGAALLFFQEQDCFSLPRTQIRRVIESMAKERAGWFEQPRHRDLLFSIRKTQQQTKNHRAESSERTEHTACGVFVPRRFGLVDVAFLCRVVVVAQDEWVHSQVLRLQCALRHVSQAYLSKKSKDPPRWLAEMLGLKVTPDGKARLPECRLKIFSKDESSDSPSHFWES